MERSMFKAVEARFLVGSPTLVSHYLSGIISACSVLDGVNSFAFGVHQGSQRVKTETCFRALPGASSRWIIHLDHGHTWIIHMDHPCVV